MTDIFVEKRSGDLERLDTGKIKSVIRWACEDLEVNALELESLIEAVVEDGISTSEIHDNIIHHAKTLARPDATDWVFVAGRLNTMKRWKETGAYQKTFLEYVREMITEGKYTHSALEKYQDWEIEYLGRCLDQERDLSHSYASTLTAESKYLLDGECIQHLFMVNAMIVFNKKELNRVVEMYDALSLREISLATPWLSNLRSGGNISSCFIIDVDDDLSNITEAWSKAAFVSKMGGGLGIYAGRLRAKGSEIGGRKDSAKSVNIAIKIFNDIAVYIDQGGKRAGAFTVALPVWHNDIEDFLHIQAETGDQRSKAHDIFPQMVTPDLYWERIKEDATWTTFDPFEAKALGYPLNDVWGKEFEANYLALEKLADEGKVTLSTKHKAKDLLKIAMRTMFDSGLPYVFFVDAANRANPNKHDGMIQCANLCVESFSNIDPYNLSHTCNLASVVAGRMRNLEHVRKTSALLCEILNEGIALTNPPTVSSKNHNDTYATIGIGVQGLHDYLVRNHTGYENTRAIQEFTEYLQYGAVEQSVTLAKEFGAYRKFEGSDWDTGVQVSRYNAKSITDLDWAQLQDKINQYGIRNSQLSSPAPNTSTSIFMDAAAGVMPVYSEFFREGNGDGKYPVAAMLLKEHPLGYMRTFRHYDQKVLSKAVGVMQRYIDTGISAEYLLDHNKEGFSAKDLFDLLVKCWENETKAVYYIRHIKKGETVEDLLGIKEEGCAGCAG